MRTTLTWLSGLLCTSQVLAQVPAPEKKAEVKTAAPAVAKEPGKLPQSLMQQTPQPAGNGQLEKVTQFDHRFAEIRWKDNHWQLVSRDTVVKDFDKRELEAQEALRIIRELRLTERATLGAPLPIMEYWLSDGRAPSASVGLGMHVMSFDPDQMSVAFLNGQWCLRDPRRAYFNFGSRADHAQRALDVIRKHHFNQVGYVGQPVPVMIYFLSSEKQAEAPPPIPSAPTVRVITPTMGPQAASGQHEPVAQPSAPQLGQSVTPRPMVQQTSASSIHLPAPTASEERIPFDSRFVKVAMEGNQWRVRLGDQLLGSFGDRERDARQAVAIMQHCRFNEIGVIGKPVPTFSYFLTNGKLPRGPIMGLNDVSFRPDQLVVQQIGKNFILTDGKRTLLALGEKAEDAQQVLQTIQRLQCDRLCRVGNPLAGGITFLERTQ